MGNTDSVFASLIYGEEASDNLFESSQGVVVSALLYGEEDFDIDAVDDRSSTNNNGTEAPLEEEYHRLETPRLPNSWDAVDEAVGLTFEERAASIYCLLVGQPAAELPLSLNGDAGKQGGGGGLRRFLSLDEMLKWPQVVTERDEAFVRRAWVQIASSIVDPGDGTVDEKGGGSPSNARSKQQQQRQGRRPPPRGGGKGDHLSDKSSRPLDFANFLRLLELFEEEAASSSDSEAGESHDMARRVSAASANSLRRAVPSSSPSNSNEKSRHHRRRRQGEKKKKKKSGAGGGGFMVERAPSEWGEDEDGSESQATFEDDSSSSSSEESSGPDPDDDYNDDRTNGARKQQQQPAPSSAAGILPPLKSDAEGHAKPLGLETKAADGGVEDVGSVAKKPPQQQQGTGEDEEPPEGCVLS